MSLVEKAKLEFEKHAKETLDVHEICGVLYAFGSELACLRLHKTYRHSGDKAASGVSPTMNTWYFRLEK